jgi:UDP-N-acetylmuramoyl-L-alanyl-D-glutamate--2,6-diaminopimelate ligase
LEDERLKLGDLCALAGLECPKPIANQEISGIQTDSGLVRSGDLYVCIRGLRTDGHAYAADAISRGAVCILTDEEYRQDLPRTVCHIKAKDTRRACAYLYNAFWGDPVSKMKFIGVTGTNGKTSVTHMLRAVMEAALWRCGLIGTVGCESVGRVLDARSDNALANMTTPDPNVLYRLLHEMAEDGVEYVIMEVTSHALALGKLAPIRFEAGIFTNLTPDHLDFHGDMERYAAVKASFFESCKLSIINTDSPYAATMMKSASGRTVTCSPSGRAAEYLAEDIAILPEGGVEYRLRSAKSRMKLRCPISGIFSVANSMQTAICAKELGVGASVIQTALASLSGIRGRMERVRLGMDADFEVLIDYAHTPDALENLLRTVAALGKKGRTVLLFGCGGDRDKSKRPIMGEIACRLADEVIVTSDNSRSEDPMEIIGDILKGTQKTNTRVIPDRREAIFYAILHARAGDVILLAGKGHEEYEINRAGRVRFSEREIVRQAYEERIRRNGQINDANTTEDE